MIFEIETDGKSFGTVKINGKAIEGVRAVNIRMQACQAPEIEIELAPMRVNVKTEAEKIICREA